jgi:hypothetical protein
VNNVPAVDGQAPARRIGGLIAVVVCLCACVCALGVWYLFAREGITALTNSISLQTKGVTTTGTVTSVEEFSDNDPSFPQSSYKVTVSFEVDGVTYSVKGSAFYKAEGNSLVGDSMPIIYDPDDPNIALIDTFQERWLEPIVNSAP